MSSAPRYYNTRKYLWSDAHEKKTEEPISYMLNSICAHTYHPSNKERPVCVPCAQKQKLDVMYCFPVRSDNDIKCVFCHINHELRFWVKLPPELLKMSDDMIGATAL